jgi:hypothetical protein
MLTDRSINDRSKLSKKARGALEGSLEPGEPVRVVVRGAFDSALVATDRRVLTWKNGRLTSFPWRNVGAVAFGGGPIVRWIQVRGPSFGLVEPSLLNIGELADTIQLGEVLSDQVRAVLDMLAERHGKRQPLDARDMAPSGRRTADHDLADDDPPLLEATGAGGALTLFVDRVRINHRGFRGFLRKALPAQKDIPLERIASVDWRSPGALRLGRIGFRHDPPSRKGVDEPEPEDQLMFYVHQEVAFREIKAEIERRRGRRSAPDPLDLRKAEPSG